MPAQAELPRRNPITYFRRDPFCSLTELSAPTKWLLGTGAGIALVGGFTALVISRMPRPSQIEQPKSQQLVTPRIEQAPKGRSLRLTLSGKDIGALMPENASSIDWIDCSTIPEGAVTVITDHQKGNNRLSYPIKGAEKIEPAIPRSEPLAVKHLIRIRSEVNETLWAVDPKPTTPNIMPDLNRLKRTVFMRVSQIENGKVEIDASLVGNLEQCDSQVVEPASAK